MTRIDLKPNNLGFLDSRYVNVTGDTMTGSLTIQPATDTLTALVVNDKDANNILTVDSINNRVGIGTTAPSGKLNIVAADGETLKLDNGTTGTNTTLRFRYNGLDKFSLYSDNGGTSFRIYSNATTTDVLYIAGSTGNVGIGIVPVQKLDVYGTSTLAATTGTTQNGLFRLQNTSNTVIDMGSNQNSPYQGWIQATDAGNLALTYPLLLNPNGGNVGIGVVGTPGTTLHLKSGGGEMLRLEATGGGQTTKIAVDNPGGTPSFMLRDGSNNTILQVGMQNIGGQGTTGLRYYQPSATIGLSTAFEIFPGTHTGLTTATENPDVYFHTGRTVTWATGNITNQRTVIMEAPTLAFAGASTVADAATLYIDNAPQVGANAAITRSYALWIDAGAVRIDDTIAAPTPTATPVFTSYYGGNTNALGDPVAWLRIYSGTTVYKIPLYT